MTRRTVARGSLTMRQDIGQRDILVDFANRVVGDPAPMDGTDVFLPENPSGTDVYTWSERDGRTVLAITEQGPQVYPIWYQGVGEKTPPFSSQPVNEITALVYIENAEGSIEWVPNMGYADVQVAAKPDVGDRLVGVEALGFNPYGKTTANTPKDLFGWVWMKLRYDVPNKTVSAKAWNDGDDEPVSFDVEIVITRQFVALLPYGRAGFWTIGMHPYSEPYITEIAQVSWRHV